MRPQPEAMAARTLSVRSLRALKPWVSTELLCWRYRFLGCKIGRRVHADFFYVWNLT